MIRELAQLIRHWHFHFLSFHAIFVQNVVGLGFALINNFF
jgi:hypothetical protein